MSIAYPTLPRPPSLRTAVIRLAAQVAEIQLFSAAKRSRLSVVHPPAVHPKNTGIPVPRSFYSNGTATALEIMVMLFISIHPYGTARMLAVLLTVVCLSTASCFA